MKRKINKLKVLVWLLLAISSFSITYNFILIGKINQAKRTVILYDYDKGDSELKEKIRRL